MARFLPFEQPLGVSRQFENLDALVHVGLVGFLVPVDLTLAPCLLGAPFGRHLVEKGNVNAPVELVHVHCIEPALQSVVFRPEPGDGLHLLPAFVGVTGVKRILHPGENLIIEMQLAKQTGELLLQRLLPHILSSAVGRVALAFIGIAGAVVINVALLLDLADHRAAASRASDQP